MSKWVLGSVIIFILTQYSTELGAKKPYLCTIHDDNITFIETVSGTKCGAEDSLIVRVRNDATEMINIELCLESKSGKWDCGSSSTKPGKTMAYWICHATGEFIYRGRKVKDWGRGCMPKDPDSKKPIPLDPAKILQKCNNNGCSKTNITDTGGKGPSVPSTIPGNPRTTNPTTTTSAPKTSTGETLGWVQFYSRGTGGKGDQGVNGKPVLVSVDGIISVKSKPLASTSIGGKPRGRCDKSSALALKSGSHWYTINNKQGKKFSLAANECKVIIIPALWH